jgi:hypothetical protein
MPAESSFATALAAQVVDASAQWCRLISEANWPALDALIDPTFSYRHATGKVDGKDVWIADLHERSRTIEASELSARVFGLVAVLSAEYVVTFTQPEATCKVVRLAALQVWTTSESRWRLVAHYTGRISEG